MSNRRHRDPIPLTGQSSTELDVIHDNDELVPADAAEAEEFRQKPRFGAVIVHHTVTVLLLALILALGVWSYLTFRKTSFLEVPDARERATFESVAVDAQLERIRFALEVYERQQEKYPTMLETLVDEGLLVMDDLQYPPGRPRYVYQRMGDGYRLAVAEKRVTLDNSPD